MYGNLKIQYPGVCLKVNTALGFTSFCIDLLTCPHTIFYTYTYSGGALNNEEHTIARMCLCQFLQRGQIRISAETPPLS